MKSLINFPFIIFLVALTVLLELGGALQIWPPFLFPRPTEIFMAFIENAILLKQATLETFFAASLGFALSLVLGIGSAILLYQFTTLRRAILPVATLLQVVPLVAVAPLLVVWFGFGITTVIAASFIVSLFPIITSTLDGFTNIQQDYVELFKTLKATRKETLLKLHFPHAIPQIISGAKVSAGLSIIGAIIGEFIAGGGLGAVIDSSRTQQRLDLVFAAIILSALVGLIFLKVFDLLKDKLLFRYFLSTKP